MCMHIRTPHIPPITLPLTQGIEVVASTKCTSSHGDAHDDARDAHDHAHDHHNAHDPNSTPPSAPVNLEQYVPAPLLQNWHAVGACGGVLCGIWVCCAEYGCVVRSMSV